jgi:hypothetical protein
LVHADLNSPGIRGLAASVAASCNGIPRPLAVKDISQAETERYWSRDRQDSARCAAASLSYVDTIGGRDKKLTGKKK